MSALISCTRAGKKLCSISSLLYRKVRLQGKYSFTTVVIERSTGQWLHEHREKVLMVK